MTIYLHSQWHSRHVICSMLHVGTHPVTNALKSFGTTGIIPEPRPRRPPKKITKAILDFPNIRTLQFAHLPCSQLSPQIQERPQISVNTRSITFKRNVIGFHCHTQELKLDHMTARVEFYRGMMANPRGPPSIHFSGESRFVFGIDKCWVLYRRAEENESTCN
jgi:hypothetical protein